MISPLSLTTLGDMTRGSEAHSSKLGLPIISTLYDQLAGSPAPLLAVDQAPDPQRGHDAPPLRKPVDCGNDR